MHVARQHDERSGKREGEEREELEKKAKKEGAPAAGSGRIRTWTRPSVELLQPDLVEAVEVEQRRRRSLYQSRIWCGPVGSASSS